MLLFHNCPRRLEGFAHLVILLCPLLMLLVDLLGLQGKVREVLAHPCTWGSHGQGHPLKRFISNCPSRVHRGHIFALGFGRPHKVLVGVLVPEPLLDFCNLGIGTFSQIDVVWIHHLRFPMVSMEGLRLMRTGSSLIHNSAWWVMFLSCWRRS